MRVLLVGGGAREHALAWKMTTDNTSLDLIAAPGNPGIASLGRCFPIPADDLAGMLNLAKSQRPDLTVVGPEAALAAGIVDLFHQAGLPTFGPTQSAAEIESSKAFSKALMLDAGVPTARAERHSAPEKAKQAARAFGAPLVIKASGLAAGKGVVICRSIAEADTAIDSMLRRRIFGDAGAEILVEEFMQGEEISLLALTDGRQVLPMLPCQDHKPLLAGDLGPNTGGMGAYAPVSIVEEHLISQIIDRIFKPTLDTMRQQGRPFAGLLYAGLMLTADGPRVVEFNCRFGDPETEALLPLLESDLLEFLLAIARGDGLGTTQPLLSWKRRYSVTTVVAAKGYPDAPRKGDVITLPPERRDIHVFHGGTTLNSAGALMTAGGRVFAVTAVADTLPEAQRESLSGATSICFDGKQFRNDIAWRELQRSARAS